MTSVEETAALADASEQTQLCIKNKSQKEAFKPDGKQGPRFSPGKKVRGWEARHSPFQSPLLLVVSLLKVMRRLKGIKVELH